MLENTQHILVEDTRNWSHLVRSCGLSPSGKVVSFNKESEHGKTPIALQALSAGEDVAMVSDAGLPILADPGLPLVQGAIAADIPVVPVAFGSPAMAALAASGLPAVPFYFEGFVPRSQNQRLAALEKLKAMACTSIIYEAPHRIEATLVDVTTVFGGAHLATLARELSKTHETFWRGTVEELVQAAQQNPPKGALILLLGPARKAEEWSEAALEKDIQKQLAAGKSPKVIRDELAEKSGLGKRVIYQKILELKT